MSHLLFNNLAAKISRLSTTRQNLILIVLCAILLVLLTAVCFGAWKVSTDLCLNRTIHNELIKEGHLPPPPLVPEDQP